jgi:hypothetical protein
LKDDKKVDAGMSDSKKDLNDDKKGEVAGDMSNPKKDLNAGDDQKADGVGDVATSTGLKEDDGKKDAGKSQTDPKNGQGDDGKSTAMDVDQEELAMHCLPGPDGREARQLNTKYKTNN